MLSGQTGSWDLLLEGQLLCGISKDFFHSDSCVFTVDKHEKSKLGGGVSVQWLGLALFLPSEKFLKQAKRTETESTCHTQEFFQKLYIISLHLRRIPDDRE